MEAQSEGPRAGGPGQAALTQSCPFNAAVPREMKVLLLRVNKGRT